MRFSIQIQILLLAFGASQVFANVAMFDFDTSLERRSFSPQQRDLQDIVVLLARGKKAKAKAKKAKARARRRAANRASSGGRQAQTPSLSHTGGGGHEQSPSDEHGGGGHEQSPPHEHDGSMHDQSPPHEHGGMHEHESSPPHVSGAGNIHHHTIAKHLGTLAGRFKTLMGHFNGGGGGEEEEEGAYRRDLYDERGGGGRMRTQRVQAHVETQQDLELEDLLDRLSDDDFDLDW